MIARLIAGTRVRTAGALVAIIAAAAAIEAWNGRAFVCRCGRVALWAGEVRSAENSQQLADWYSLSHIVHGLLFYGATRMLLPRMPLGARIVVAALVEATWEVVENTPLVIDRYRAETMSWGYTGDSILNSAGDMLFMLAGFAIAARLRAVWAVALGLALELIALAAIRDNLTLNVLMLLHPIEAVRAWQAG